MNMSEILKKIADIIDTNADEESEENNVMLTPLQAKHELLKKSVGIENEYDKQSEVDFQDELNIMKKNAGIHNNPSFTSMCDDNDIIG